MEPTPPATPWYRSPFWLAVLGLALMIGGYQLSRYVPETPRDRQQADELAGLRDKTDDEALRERFDDFAKNTRREPPYHFPGLLVVFLGGALFVAAGVMMVRQPARPAEDTSEEAPHGDEDVDVDQSA